MAGLDSDRY